MSEDINQKEIMVDVEDLADLILTEFEAKEKIVEQPSQEESNHSENSLDKVGMGTHAASQMK